MRLLLKQQGHPNDEEDGVSTGISERLKRKNNLLNREQIYNHFLSGILGGSVHISVC